VWHPFGRDQKNSVRAGTIDAIEVDDEGLTRSARLKTFKMLNINIAGVVPTVLFPRTILLACELA
jgi:hypothetical protein